MRKKGFQYTVRELETRVSIHEYLKDCVDVPRFFACCKACSNYGAIWACPPYDFDPIDIWNRYTVLRLYARMLIPDFAGQDCEAALRALGEEKDALLDILFKWESENPGSRALAAGSCSLCASCARSAGQPCQNPKEMRYSIESLGGDVDKTASRYFGYPLLWIQDGALPKYLMLVGGLLLPGGKAETPVESVL